MSPWFSAANYLQISRCGCFATRKCAITQYTDFKLLFSLFWFPHKNLYNFKIAIVLDYIMALSYVLSQTFPHVKYHFKRDFMLSRYFNLDGVMVFVLVQRAIRFLVQIKFFLLKYWSKWFTISIYVQANIGGIFALEIPVNTEPCTAGKPGSNNVLCIYLCL